MSPAGLLLMAWMKALSTSGLLQEGSSCPIALRAKRAAIRKPAMGHGKSELTRRLLSVRWTPETGQVAKRESPLGTAGWPEVRHDQYTEEAQR